MVKTQNQTKLVMVWKIVLLSISIVVASFVIAGAIVAAQVLSGNVDFEDGELGEANQDAVPIPSNAMMVSIVGDQGSNSYSPDPMEIKVGETVAWVNDDSNLHTATSKSGVFSSDVLFEGQSFSYTFDRKGEYPYVCDIHPGMEGTVIVI